MIVNVINIQLGFRCIEHDFSDLNDLLNSLKGREMEAVVLHRVGFLAYSCPKQGQDFKHSAAPLYPNMGQVPPPPPGDEVSDLIKVNNQQLMNSFKDLLHRVRGPN